MSTLDVFRAADCARLVETNHQNSPVRRLQRAAEVALLVLGCLALARTASAQASLEPEPEHDPQYTVGMKLVKAGSFSDAVAAIGKALEKNPNDTWALTLRGFAWSSLGNRDKAMADFNEAIRLQPKSWRLYVSRANVWQGQREFDKAIADYSEAIRLDPTNAHLYTNRASVLNEKREYDKALDDLKEALRLDPKDDYALVNRAAAEHSKGEYEKAIADLKEAIRLDPNSPDAYNGLAWLQATCPDSRLRDGHEAYKNARRAYAITNGGNASNVDTLAAAYAEFGDFQAACKWQAKAIELLKVEKDKEEGRSRLELYKTGRPYREDPATR